MSGEVELRNKKDCTNTQKVITFSKQHNLAIKEGKGDHFQIYDDKSGTHVTAVRKREMSIGVAGQIWNFFKAIGLVLIALALLAGLVYML